MKHHIEISSKIVKNVFRHALLMKQNSRENFIYDIRKAFYEEIIKLLQDQNIAAEHKPTLRSTNYKNGKIVSFEPIISKYNEPLGIDFCSKYGYDNKSIFAINYIEDDYCHLPSLLSFSKNSDLSIGNFAFPLHPDDYEVELIFASGVKAVGYGYHVSKRKLKPGLFVWGVTFTKKLIDAIINENVENKCKCCESELDEIRIGNIPYPVIYICRICGQLFICKCFKNYIDIQNDIVRILPSRGEYLRNQVKNIKTKNKICHLCTGNIPKIQYGSSMYYSLFMQKYLPYHIFRHLDLKESAMTPNRRPGAISYREISPLFH